MPHGLRRLQPDNFMGEGTKKGKWVKGETDRKRGTKTRDRAERQLVSHARQQPATSPIGMTRPPTDGQPLWVSRAVLDQRHRNSGQAAEMQHQRAANDSTGPLNNGGRLVPKNWCLTDDSRRLPSDGSWCLTGKQGQR